ncbi:MAG: hypothetical protein FWH51_01920 [Dehalococcoidia bacterium]|nr:hypothetical protein [Dehalococcoidia bacterium]
MLGIVLSLPVTSFSCVAIVEVGDGSPERPFIVKDATGLDAVRHNLSACYRLANDIDLASYLAPGGEGYTNWGSEGWEPLGWQVDPFGTQADPFTGSFDGNGHRIIGLWIDRPNQFYVGLFGVVAGGTIKNLGLEIDSSLGIVSRYAIGGLAGWQKSDGDRNSIITDCYAIGNIVIDPCIGAEIIGGLVGYQSGNSTIANCYASGDIGFTESDCGSGYAGGLVGVQWAIGNANCVIADSYAVGDVVGGRYIGGLVGRQSADGGSNATINNCYAIGYVSGGSDVGGLVGSQSSYDDSISSIINCYAAVSVVGKYDGGTFVGGLAGNQTSASDGICIITNCYATGNINNGGPGGGLVGVQSAEGGSNATINNCYATGTVGTFIAGGLVGKQNAGLNSTSTISGSYATGEVAGSGNVAGGLVGVQLNDIGTNVIVNSYASGGVTAKSDMHGNSSVGGLVGEQGSYDSGNGFYPSCNAVTNCYAVGYVQTASFRGIAGGLVGKQTATGGGKNLTTACFFDIQTTHQGLGVGNDGTAVGASGNTTAEMKKQAIFAAAGWDFTGTYGGNPTWYMIEGATYPKLS